MSVCADADLQKMTFPSREMINYYGGNLFRLGILSIVMAAIIRPEDVSWLFVVPAGFSLGLLIGVIYFTIFNRIPLTGYLLVDIVLRWAVVNALLLGFMLFLVFTFDPANLHGRPGFEELSLGKVLAEERFLSALAKIFRVSLLLILYQEIKSYLGISNLLQLLVGKYHYPTQEDRIFLFLDLKNSTALTEELGNTRYFDFLNTFLKSMSRPIILSGATVYQYVGDEVVLTWKMGKDQRTDQTLRFLAELRKVMTKREGYFRDRFGAVPQYRIGVHAGSAVAARVGEIKKNLVFSGDVLNTTSRIQGLCKPLQTDLLFSESIAKGLGEELRSRMVSFGQHSLRGRQELETLYSFPEYILPGSPSAIGKEDRQSASS